MVSPSLFSRSARVPTRWFSSDGLQDIWVPPTEPMGRVPAPGMLRPYLPEALTWLYTQS